MSDSSLYQIAVEAIKPISPLYISLSTLNSLIGALIDLLIENNISATLWIKQPVTENWQAELEKYQQLNIGQSIYFYNCSDDLQEVNARSDSLIFVKLAESINLQQEYFFLIIAEKFSSLIITSQPETVRAESLNHIQQRLAVYTWERQVIQQVLPAMRDLIVSDLKLNKLLNVDLKAPLNLAEDNFLLNQLLIKQVERTEDTLLAASVEHLRNKDELLRRVAQEIRTPLTNMKTALRLLDSSQIKIAQRQRYMQLLHGECDRQNSLITGLLELVKLDSETQPSVMPSLQLVDIVPGVVSTYQPLAQEKGIQLGYTIPAELPAVLCLENWLKQIVINLLHNCLKFTPSGGQVSVKATLQGVYIQLVFSDTGIGIALSEIPKIFDSFYRGRAATGDDIGAGLGLTIVQQLLLRCGGSIVVTSQLGEGSNFKVLLPIATTKTSEVKL